MVDPVRQPYIPLALADVMTGRHQERARSTQPAGIKEDTVSTGRKPDTGAATYGRQSRTALPIAGDKNLPPSPTTGARTPGVESGRAAGLATGSKATVPGSLVPVHPFSIRQDYVRQPLSITEPPLPNPLSAGLSGPSEAGDQLERLPTIPSDTLNRTFHDYENPIPQVISLLRDMGIDASNLNIERWDERVANWGGNYTNHYIRVQLGNGVTENFSLEYTIRNPKITAVEIARLLRGGPVIS